MLVVFNKIFSFIEISKDYDNSVSYLPSIFYHLNLSPLDRGNNDFITKINYPFHNFI